jgi:hypothetical protein
MRPALRLSLSVLGIVVIAVPFSVLITILLFPLWSWLEASTGIESVGHSGPAAWCYATVFLTFVTSAVLMLLLQQK